MSSCEHTKPPRTISRLKGRAKYNYGVVSTTMDEIFYLMDLLKSNSLARDLVPLAQENLQLMMRLGAQEPNSDTTLSLLSRNLKDVRNLLRRVWCLLSSKFDPSSPACAPEMWPERPTITFNAAPSLTSTYFTEQAVRLAPAAATAPRDGYRPPRRRRLPAPDAE